MILLLQFLMIAAALGLLALVVVFDFVLLRRIARYISRCGGIAGAWRTPPHSVWEDLRALAECWRETLSILRLRRVA